MHGKSYITIKNCIITGGKWFGLLADSNSNNISIDTNYISNTKASGIYVNSTWTMRINGNTVDNACNGTSTSPQVQECISIVDTSNFQVSYNEIRNSWVGISGGEGIDAKGRCTYGLINNNQIHDLARTGIYIDAWDQDEHDITVRNNSVRSCRHGIALSSEAGGSLHDLWVNDNYTGWNLQYGIVVPNWEMNGRRSNIQIQSNWVENNKWGITVESSNVLGILIRWNTVKANTDTGINIWPFSGVTSYENTVSP